VIISFKHNYIYFRPRKTGSSTIEYLLSRRLGPEDILAGGRVLEKSGMSEAAVALSVRLATHATARQVKDVVPEAFWERCYKFASERHPYEKAVSLAFYRMHKRERRGVEAQTREFARVLDQVVKGDIYVGFETYSLEGKPVADDFVRHETFDEDLRRIAKRLRLWLPRRLPRLKGNLRLDRRPAAEILSDEQKETIFRQCRQEFEFFGYPR